MQLMQLQQIERLTKLAHFSLVAAVSSLDLHREVVSSLSPSERDLIDAQVVRNIVLAYDALSKALEIVPDYLK